MTNLSTSSSSIHQNVVPSEVGWQFVPQYYTFVNKHPNRLHCFYTKQSTFTHGTEGEDSKPCYGQHEIHQKITSIGFQDCKVFIHSVDAQSSANGGIIIQVIGEMSNHGDQWRKFVQTFFLAEQPNGYFVLNDIFRFLKEESVEGDDAGDAVEPEQTASSQAVPEVVAAPAQPTPVPEPVREPTPPLPPSFTPAVEESPTTVSTDLPVVETPAPEAQVPVAPPTPETNGIRVPEVEIPAPSVEVAEKPLTPAPPPQQQLPVVPSPSAPQPPVPSVTTPASTSASTLPHVSVPPQPVAPTPTAPPQPRTWAHLAATNSKKWGSAVATEIRGTSEVPISISASPGPGSGTQTPAAGQSSSGVGRGQHHHQGGQGRSDHHPAFVAAQSVTTPQCFVKGVVESVTPNALTAHLGQRFGPVKDVEIMRQRMCAFIEFNTVDAARRAIIASLPPNQGGEGGLWIDVGGDAGQVRIFVETKKERGERNTGRPRGGPPMVNGEGRGTGGAGAGGHSGQGGYNRRGTGRGGRGAGPK
ncbi:hypothetical protein AMATHDRAFT_76120 [Amanita thiersii Skay4041]|uniref:NTF2 domain-containing protein n=1 Tax=Amanita thiersii Skay4041 TaxID=703135 RepID=A0A2A9NPB7_9AGAR|nr:hypothetical protein AMATHDRAFT_76120 [Amanita thiersii Skay4041]